MCDASRLLEKQKQHSKSDNNFRVNLTQVASSFVAFCKHISLSLKHTFDFREINHDVEIYLSHTRALTDVYIML